MTDEQIIKALSNLWYGGHSCMKCKQGITKGDNRCGLKGCYIARLAIDLINRQKAENERLQEENKNQNAVIQHIEDIINPLPFETDFAKAIRIAKSEAIKEFAKKLKEKAEFLKDDDDYIGYVECVRVCHIDNLLKEMTEGK